MNYNYPKYKNLPPSVQSIVRNKAISEELGNDARRKALLNTDKENCKKIKMLLSEGHDLKSHVAKGTKCIFELEKNDITEKIEIVFTDNINKIKELLNISE